MNKKRPPRLYKTKSGKYYFKLNGKRIFVNAKNLNKKQLVKTIIKRIRRNGNKLENKVNPNQLNSASGIASASNSNINSMLLNTLIGKSQEKPNNVIVVPSPDKKSESKELVVQNPDLLTRNQFREDIFQVGSRLLNDINAIDKNLKKIKSKNENVNISGKEEIIQSTPLKSKKEKTPDEYKMMEDSPKKEENKSKKVEVTPRTKEYINFLRKNENRIKEGKEPLKMYANRDKQIETITKHLKKKNNNFNPDEYKDALEQLAWESKTKKKGLNVTADNWFNRFGEILDDKLILKKLNENEDIAKKDNEEMQKMMEDALNKPDELGTGRKRSQKVNSNIDEHNYTLSTNQINDIMTKLGCEKDGYKGCYAENELISLMLPLIKEGEKQISWIMYT